MKATGVILYVLVVAVFVAILVDLILSIRGKVKSLEKSTTVITADDLIAVIHDRMESVTVVTYTLGKEDKEEEK